MAKTGTRRQKQKAETREIIRANAYRLFEEKGYEKTTMRELAARAEVGLGTIFQHFPDKPSLLVAVFEEDLGRVIERGFQTMPQHGLKPRLLHLVRHIFGFYAQRPALSRVLIKEVFFMEGPFADKIDALVFALLDRIAVIFEEAKEQGEIKAEVTGSDAALAFWACYSLSLIIGLRLPVFDVEAQVSLLESFLDQHLSGIGITEKP